MRSYVPLLDSKENIASGMAILNLLPMSDCKVIE